jgi:hypothetical protein
MASYGMLRRVALVRTDVSVELSVSIFKVTRIGELGTTLAVTSNRLTLSSSETSVLTRATRRNIQVDGILHCENLSLNKRTLSTNLIAYILSTTNRFEPQQSSPVYVRLL